MDKAVRNYCIFMLSFPLLLFAASLLFCLFMTRTAKSMLLSHDEAVASSLTGQGISETVIAEALTATEHSDTAHSLLQKTGIRPALEEVSCFCPSPPPLIL